MFRGQNSRRGQDTSVPLDSLSIAGRPAARQLPGGGFGPVHSAAPARQERIVVYDKRLLAARCRRRGRGVELLACASDFWLVADRPGAERRNRIQKVAAERCQ